MSVDDEWWCPTEERLVSCPGPCPDGRVHTGPLRAAHPSVPTKRKVAK